MAAHVRRALIDTINADSAFMARKATPAPRPGSGGGAATGHGMAAARDANRTTEPATNATAPRTTQAFVSDAALEETFFRQRCLSLQQTMETRIAHLRAHLRQSLTACSADGARLAAVDAVLERALSQKERALLAGVSDTLGRYFRRLHAHAQDLTARNAADGPLEQHALQPAPRAWIDGFRDTMRGVMLAELALRFTPIEGLAAALHAPHTSS